MPKKENFRVDLFLGNQHKYTWQRCPGFGMTDLLFSGIIKPVLWWCCCVNLGRITAITEIYNTATQTTVPLECYRANDRPYLLVKADFQYVTDNN